MRFLSGRLIVAAGVALTMVGLLAFSLGSPDIVVGQETDVDLPDVEEPAEPPASLPGAVESASAVIGPSGGTLSTGSGDSVEASLSIPSGALPEDTSITVDVLPTSDVPLPPGAGNFLSRAFDFGPDGTTFDPPALIVFNYEDSEVAGLDENALRVWLFDSATGTWEQLSVISRDTTSNTLTIEVSHFSIAVVGEDTAGGTDVQPADALPDAGTGGYAESTGFTTMLVVTLLAALGVTLAGAGVIALRLGRRVQGS